MPKARMLAGGIIEPGAGSPGAVVAYVAVSGARATRLFRVDGPASQPRVHELPSATTVDLGRFDREARDELYPAVQTIEGMGGKAAVTKPSPIWVCSHVRAHIKAVEGLDVD